MKPVPTSRRRDVNIASHLRSRSPSPKPSVNRSPVKSRYTPQPIAATGCSQAPSLPPSTGSPVASSLAGALLSGQQQSQQSQQSQQQSLQQSLQPPLQQQNGASMTMNRSETVESYSSSCSECRRSSLAAAGVHDYGAARDGGANNIASNGSALSHASRGSRGSRGSTGSGGGGGGPQFDVTSFCSSPESSIVASAAQRGIIPIPYKYDSKELTFKQKFCYYVPCCTWMSTYNGEELIHDVIGGLSLASYQIPLCMSFATSVAHVPALCGLLGLTIAPMVYMFLGTVPHMIVGPEAAVSIIVGQSIEKVLKHNKGLISAVDLLTVICSASGGILLGFGFLRFGFIDNILCSALLKAFVCSIGVTMLVNSAISILGLDGVMNSLPPTVHIHSPYQKLVFLFSHISEYNKATTIIGASTFIVLYVLKSIKNICIKKRVRFATFFPEILLVVVFCTALSAALGFENHGIDVVGLVDVKGVKLHVPFSPSLGHWYGEVFSVGFACAILGFFESSTAGKSLGGNAALPMSSNRELIALGAIGVTTSIFGALPSFGGYARSKLNSMNGGKTPAAGFFMGFTALLVMLFLMDYLYYLPICVLTAVVAIVGTSLLSETPGELRFHIRTKGYNELFTYFITFVAAFFSSVELGVAIGTFYSLMRVVKHSTLSRIQILTRECGTDVFVNSEFADPKIPGSNLPQRFIVKGYSEYRTAPKTASDPDAIPEITPNLEDRESCLIVKIPEPLTFTNANDLKTRLKRVELFGSVKSHPGSVFRADHELRHIVFDLHGMTSLDSSASQILADIVERYLKRGIDVFFCRVYRSRSLLERLDDSGIKGKLETSSGAKYTSNQSLKPYFDTILDALKAVEALEGNSEPAEGESVYAESNLSTLDVTGL